MSKIIEIPLKELHVDPSLSGRSAKEIRDNAKELAPKIEAFGGWDESQPGQFFIRDGKKHLSAGFTRVAACEIAAVKVGAFVEIKDDPAQLQTSAIRTNSGKPISQYEQGRIYALMRDGTDAEKAPKGSVILPSKTTVEIANELGYTRQHIEACLGIFEETPEIGELIAEEKVSPNVVTRAQQLVKAPGKRLEMLKAATRKAKEDGKETATMQHLKAVQDEFADKPKKEKEAPAKKENGKKPEAPETPQSTSDLGTTNKPLTEAEVLSLAISTILAADDTITASQSERAALALINAGFTHQ